MKGISDGWAEVSKSLTSPPATPGNFPGTFPFCQEHILCFAAGGLKPCAEILILPHACFQNGAGFHFLSRSSSAFVIYVNLLRKNHGKANYCPDTMFRQTSNVSPGFDCGISDSPSLCQCVIRAIVVTRAGLPEDSSGQHLVLRQCRKQPSPPHLRQRCASAVACPRGAQHPQVEHGHFLQQLPSSQTHTLHTTWAAQLPSQAGPGICFCTAFIQVMWTLKL